MPSRTPPWISEPRVTEQAEVIERLSCAITAGPEWRWLEVCCSLARGTADELSDVDAAVGYGGALRATNLEAAGVQLVRAGGPVLDVLIHVLPGSPPETRRLAAEYTTGVQLDLVLMPSERRMGLPERAVAVVDKDQRLARPWRPPIADPPSAEEAREWVMLGWWALSDVAKYLRRAALYEAVERITEARHHALRLIAVGRGVEYPSFGLVSLLDFAPHELPESLASTYCRASDPLAVHAAAEEIAHLLERATSDAETTIGRSLQTPWAESAQRRLAEAGRTV